MRSFIFRGKYLIVLMCIFFFGITVAHATDVSEHVGAWQLTRTTSVGEDNQPNLRCVMGVQVDSHRYVQWVYNGNVGMSVVVQDSAWNIPVGSMYNVVFSSPNHRWERTGKFVSPSAWVSNAGEDGSDMQEMMDNMEHGMVGMHIHWDSSMQVNGVTMSAVPDISLLPNAMQRFWACMSSVTLPNMGKMLPNSPNNMENTSGE